MYQTDHQQKTSTSPKIKFRQSPSGYEFEGEITPDTLEALGAFMDTVNAQNIRQAKRVNSYKTEYDAPIIVFLICVSVTVIATINIVMTNITTMVQPTTTQQVGVIK